MPSSPSATVISRFHESVARHRDRPAIQLHRTVTYAELDRLSDQMARHLASLPAATAPVIGLSLATPIEVIAAMLGVLKTGCAYTLVAPDAPVPRSLAIAREMALETVMGGPVGTKWPGYSGHWIDSSVTPTASGPKDIFTSAGPADACSIVQTSGTTGEPLGVEISHAALLHTIDNYTALAQITAEDRLTLLTSPAHFAAHTAIFGALLNGACLCPFDVRREGFSAMADWLVDERLTIFQSPPSLFRAFCRQLPASRYFPALRFLRLGGEPALVSDHELFRQHFPPDAQFVNALGISEAAGNVASLVLEGPTSFPGQVLPVGFPARGSEVFLADPTGNLVSDGESGEIVVRSDFLATGYYRRPELTAQKFRTSGHGGLRELWTGDLGHWTPEGWLVHDGRKDEQAKVRGQRVDLAGIESILRSLPDVLEAKVLLRATPGKDDDLVAFVVPVEKPVTGENIYRQLAAHAAGSVLPRIFLLDQLPLTPGGKLDRARLGQLAAEATGRPASPGPREETEHIVAAVWNSVLNAADIGVYDDFFAAGGDSLKALNVRAALESQYRVRLSAALFLDRPTIAQMAEYLRSKKTAQKFRGLRSVLTGEKSEQVVPLLHSPESSRTPLFICPGGWGHEGELFVFAALVRHLTSGESVYGLKQNFLASSAPVAASVKIMARNFLTGIRKIQPHGPYRLLGECVGSIIILSLADQLRLAGERVERIILLDPRSPRAALSTNAAETKALPPKVRRYYRILSEAKLPRCDANLDVMGIDEAETRRRLKAWPALNGAQINFIRVSGNHASYLREHATEVAAAISRLLPTTIPDPIATNDRPTAPLGLS